MIDLEHFNEFLKYYDLQELKQIDTMIEQEITDRNKEKLDPVILYLQTELTNTIDLNSRLMNRIDLLEKKLDQLEEENNTLQDVINLYQLFTIPAVNTEEELEDLF